MAAFAQWLIGFGRSFIVWLWNAGIDCIQLVNDGLVTFIISIVSLLPEGSQMPGVGTAPESETWLKMLQALNWIFPVSFLVTVVGLFAAGCLLYVCIAPLARWAKLLT